MRPALPERRSQMLLYFDWYQWPSTVLLQWQICGTFVAHKYATFLSISRCFFHFWNCRFEARKNFLTENATNLFCLLYGLLFSSKLRLFVNGSDTCGDMLSATCPTWPGGVAAGTEWFLSRSSKPPKNTIWKMKCSHISVPAAFTHTIVLGWLRHVDYQHVIKGQLTHNFKA